MTKEEYNNALCREKHKNIDEDFEKISHQIEKLTFAVHRLEIIVIIVAVISKIDPSFIKTVLAGVLQ